MIPGEKPEGTVFEPSNTVPLGPWSMYKNVLAEYNLTYCATSNRLCENL